jgi:hypothetical protein
MAFYNTTNLSNADTIYGVTQAANQLGGGLIGIFFIVVIIAIAFLSLSPRFNFASSLTAAFWLGSFIGILLYMVELLPMSYLIMLGVATGGLTIISTWR